MGMVNAVVPPSRSKRLCWAKEIMTKSLIAIKMLKFGFNLIDDDWWASRWRGRGHAWPTAQEARREGTRSGKRP